MLLCFLLVGVANWKVSTTRAGSMLNICCSQVLKWRKVTRACTFFKQMLCKSFVCVIVWAGDKQSRSRGAVEA